MAGASEDELNGLVGSYGSRKSFKYAGSKPYSKSVLTSRIGSRSQGRQNWTEVIWSLQPTLVSVSATAFWTHCSFHTLFVLSQPELSDGEDSSKEEDPVWPTEKSTSSKMWNKLARSQKEKLVLIHHRFSALPQQVIASCSEFSPAPLE